MQPRTLYNRAEACFIQDDGSIAVYSKRIGSPPMIGELVRLAKPPVADGPLFDKFSKTLVVREIQYLNFAQLPNEVREDVIALLRGMAPQPYAPYIKHVLE